MIAWLHITLTHDMLVIPALARTTVSSNFNLQQFPEATHVEVVQLPCMTIQIPGFAREWWTDGRCLDLQLGGHFNSSSFPDILLKTPKCCTGSSNP